VIDLYGKVVLRANVPSTAYRINTSALATGTYFVQVIDGEKTYAERIVVK
jgi:hypothetical protein